MSSKRPEQVGRVPAVKIAVCVKQVPDATAVKRLDPGSSRLDRTGEGALNATDINAVEEALRLKESHDGEVVVVSLGPEKAMESLRKALAMGADRAVLVSDEAAAGSDLVATSYVLATVLERESPDLILFGQQSSDGDGAVMWAAVADRLARPLVSQVAALTIEGVVAHGKAADRVRVRRHSRAAPGRGRRVRRDQRAAVSIAQGDHGREVEAAGDSRPRGRRRRRRAASASPARGHVVLATTPPPPKSGQVKLEDDGSAAEKIVEYLAEKRLI